MSSEATLMPTPTIPIEKPQGRGIRSVSRNLWWFIIPALAIYLFVMIVPTIRGSYYAFTDWSATKTAVNWVGLENFQRLFRGDAGGVALRTLFLAVVTVVIQNIAGLLLAILLNGRIRGRNVLRTIIFAPLVVSPLVVGYLFKYIFGPPGSGVANDVLNSLGRPSIDFLGNPTIGLWIIVIVIVWQFTGSAMVIYLAGLQGIPPELNEACALDGATAWQRFWNVTRPLLAPAITINLMLGMIGGLKIFDQVFSTTGGGPAGKTKTISVMIYDLFSQFGRYGQSAALAVLLAVFVAFFSVIQFTILRRQEKKSS